MTAPPHAQAQSFARAILTDIAFFPSYQIDRACKAINPYYHASGLINQELHENNMVNVSFGGCLIAGPEQNLVAS
jgi:hypothetical protein